MNPFVQGCAAGERAAGGTRRTHWLDRERLRTYSAAVLVIVVYFVLRTVWEAWQRYRQPAGMDFVTFWAASRMWLEGTPLKAYSYEAMTRLAQQVAPHFPTPAPFFYPPNFLLLLRPLALLPCSVAYVIFAFATAGIFVRLLRKVLPMREALLPILAFPGIWLNLVQGQNAALTASLALGAFLLMKKRPVLAGICIGMLSIKPHLAVLFPVALACAGMWTAFTAAAITVAIFTGLSIAVFGVAAVPAFLHGLHFASGAVAHGSLPWSQMASVFVSLRKLHVPVNFAYAGQAASALIAVFATSYAWKRSDDLALRAMALVAATFLVSPYIYHYDTAWLGGAIALFAAKGLRDGWLRGEREILCIAWIYPPLGVVAGQLSNAGIGPLVFVALLIFTIRRVKWERANAVASGIGSQSLANTPS